MASAGAIRAGRAFVELATNNVLLIRGLADAAKRVTAFGSTMVKASLAMTAAGGGLLAPITKAFKDSFNRAADMKDLSDRFGMTAEKVSAMAYAFEQGGSDLNEFGATMDHVQQKMFSAADGSDETFRRLGLNARNMAKMPLDKQFDLILSRVNRLANPMDRATVGAELFGEAWKKLSNTTLQSSEAFDASQMEAYRRELVTTTKEAEQGKQISLAFTNALNSLKYGVLEIGKALLPQAGMIGGFSEMIKTAVDAARSWIKENRGAILVLVKIGGALVAGGVALGVFSSIIGTLTTGLGVVGVALKLVIATVGFLLSPIGLVVLAVAGLTAAWLTLSESGKQAASSIGALFKELGDTFSTTWGGIKNAVAAGDLELALKVAGAGLQSAWADIMYRMTEVWVKFKDTVIGGWNKIGDGVEDAIVGFQGAWTEIVEGKEASEKFMTDIHGVLGADRTKRDADNRKFRDDQIADAKTARDKAKADLDELGRVAAIKAEQADAKKRQQKINDAWDMAQKKKAEDAAASKGSVFSNFFNAAARMKQSAGDPSQLYTAAKGTFASIGGGNVRQSLGYGDNIGQRILTVNKQQLGALGGIKKAIEQKTGVTWK